MESRQTYLQKGNITLVMVLILFAAFRLLVGSSDFGAYELVFALLCGLIEAGAFLLLHRFPTLKGFRWYRFAQIILLSWLLLNAMRSLAAVLLLPYYMLLVMEFFSLCDFQETSTRGFFISLGFIPLLLFTVLRQFLNVKAGEENYAIELVAVLVMQITTFVYIANTVVDWGASLQEKVFEKSRLAEHIRSMNQAMKTNQAKLKKVNEEIGIQKIKLEAANALVNRANSEMKVQNDILKDITSSLEIERVMAHITEIMVREVQLSLCMILLKKDAVENKEALCRLAAMESERIKDDLVAWAEQEEGVFARGEPVHEAVIRSSELLQLRKEGLTTALFLPLRWQERCIGGFLFAHETEAFFEENIEFYETIVSQFQLALNNVRLYKQVSHNAVRDGLTGIFNRRQLNVRMDELEKRVEKSGEALTVALLDIDRFKRVNDTYGHLFGDSVIVMIAHMADEMAQRHGGIAARYGGEEFVLVLPSIDAKQGAALMEELRMKIRATHLKCGDEQVSVRVSIGLTSYPELCKNPRELLNRADIAMYHSKQNGRDCLSVDSERIQSLAGQQAKTSELGIQKLLESGLDGVKEQYGGSDGDL